MLGLISARTGIITHTEPFVSELLPRAMVAWLARAVPAHQLPQSTDESPAVFGFGGGTSSAEAFSAAVGEAVERYGWSIAGRNSHIEWGSFRDFDGDAVHGEAFALPSLREIASGFVPFDEKTPRGWVAGHDLTLDRQVLVPAQLVLGSYQPRFGGERLAPGTSSGLAAHPDRATAILTGLREIQERDAFTIRHLNRWTPPEISVSGVSRDIEDLLASIRRWQPTLVRAWDVTLDLGQPVVLAAVLPRNGQLPWINLGAACRGDQASALRKAVLEAFQILAAMFNRGYPAAATPEPLSAVARPEDHIRMSCLPDYRHTLAWLLDEHICPVPAAQASDPVDDANALSAAVAAVARRGLRVITVDLTPPDVREVGWHVYRVLIPGAQPLNFGRIQCRKNNRLYSVPVDRGWCQQPLRESELNSAPHPFA